jgi:hypothetical protein
MGAIDLAIVAVAGRQHGVFARQQWLDLEGTDDGLCWRMATGALTDEGPGVYGFAGWPASWSRELWRAWLLAGPHAVVAHEAAASLHRAYPFPRFGRLELSVPHGDHHRPSIALVHQPRDLTPDQITVIDGLPTTTLARTFCDLAAHTSRERLGRAIEQAELERKCRISEVFELYERLKKPGKPGFGLLASVLAVRMPGFVVPESELERMFRRLLTRFGLPQPRWQTPLPWDPRRRADGHWVGTPELLELDSRTWHGRQDQMTADRKRDREARRHGYHINRFTYEEVKHEPSSVAADVREILASTRTGGHSPV